MSYLPKLSSLIFTDKLKMYLAYALTVAYSPNVSLLIAFTYNNGSLKCFSAMNDIFALVLAYFVRYLYLSSINLVNWFV